MCKKIRQISKQRLEHTTHSAGFSDNLERFDSGLGKNSEDDQTTSLTVHGGVKQSARTKTSRYSDGGCAFSHSRMM